MPATGHGFAASPEEFQSHRRLSAFDAQFLAAETDTMLCHYMGVAVFGPDAEGAPLTVERVRAHVGDRIDRIPPLRLRVKQPFLHLDHPMAVDGEIDIERHVLRRPVTGQGTLHDLGECAARIMGERMDASRPLWEFHVITGLADGRTAVGMKFHHAAADALGASLVAGLLLDPTPDGRRGLPARVPVKRPPLGPELSVRAAARSVTFPLRAARAGARVLPHLDQVPMMRTLPGARAIAGTARRVQRARGQEMHESDFPEAPRTRFNGPLSAKRSVAFGRVSVADVRAAKTHYGVSFNDLVVAAVAGGVRRRLLATNELPTKPLLAFVPANVRTEEQTTQGGNAISSYVVTIPTDVRDGAERVAAASTALTAAKGRHAATPATLMDDANVVIPPAVFGPFARAIMRTIGNGGVAPPLNILISNVPGPPIDVYMDGAPMERFGPASLIFSGAALNVTVISYADRLEIGACGDRVLVPDAWELVEDIEAEFADLIAAAGIGG